MNQHDDAPVNEIHAAASSAKRSREAVAGLPEPARKRNWPLAEIGIGIGSAALAAALIYASRDRLKRGA